MHLIHLHDEDLPVICYPFRSLWWFFLFSAAGMDV